MIWIKQFILHKEKEVEIFRVPRAKKLPLGQLKKKKNPRQWLWYILPNPRATNKYEWLKLLEEDENSK